MDNKGDATASAVRGETNFGKSFVDVLKSLPTDFKIICRQNAAHQQKAFEVHAFILTKYHVFEAMLDSGLKEQQEKQLVIVGWNSQVVEKFIHFLYNDWVKDIESVAEDLMKLAHKYMVVRLVNLCGDAISLQNKKVADAIAVFDLANKYDVSSLKLKCQRELPAKVSSFTMEQLSHVMMHSDGMHQVAAACGSQFILRITAENVFELFAIAREKAYSRLYDEALVFVKTNWNTVRQRKPDELTEFAKWHAEGFMTGNLGFSLVEIDSSACAYCKKSWCRPGERCSCGHVKCPGCGSAHSQYCRGYVES